jgi:hypothetical protein
VDDHAVAEPQRVSGRQAEGAVPQERRVDGVGPALALDEGVLAPARAAVVRRRRELDWAALAEPTWVLLDDVAAEGARRRPR